MKSIKRENLRDRVRDSVREQIVSGSLAPGAELPEPAISAELGVSRTPLREALLQLEREGIVRSAPAKGFVVAPLTVDEVGEIFPVVGVLHGLALRQAGVPAPQHMELLRSLNGKIGTGDDAEDVFVQDLNWHKVLLMRCKNRRLLDLIDVMYDATRRYDLAYFREAGDARVSAREHGQILDELDRGDVIRAAGLLDVHWARSADPLRKWLHKKESQA